MAQTEPEAEGSPRARPPGHSPHASSPAAPAKKRRTPAAAILVLAFLSAGLALAGSVYYAYERSTLRKAKFHELAAIADLKVREIASWRAERLADAVLPRRNPFAAAAIRQWLLGDASDVELRRRLAGWIEGLRRDRGYWGVLLLDARGEVRLSSPAGLTVEPEAFSDTVKSLARSGPVFSNFHRTGPEGKIVLSLVSPVPGSEEPGSLPAGFLVLKVDPERFLYPFLQLWPTPSRSAETLLVERQGDEAVYLNELRHRKGTALRLRRPLQDLSLPSVRAAVTGSGQAQGKDYRGVPVLAVFRRVPGSPWVLVAKEDERATYAPLTQSALLLGGAVGALVLAAGSAFLFTAARHTARIERQGAEALRESEERFRAIFDKAGVGIVEVSGDDRLIAVNDRICEILGYSPEEMLALSVRDLTAPEDRPLSDEMNRQVHEGRRERVVYDKRYLRRDGTPVWVHVNVSGLRDAAGRWLRSVATVEDISARKEAEEALRASEAQFRQVAEALPQLVWMAGPGGAVDFLNRRWYDHTGMSPGEALGVIWAFALHPEDREPALARWHHSVHTGEPYEVEYRVRRGSDGSYHWFLARGLPLRDEHGRIVRWFGTSTDIHLQKEAQEALRESEERFRGVFENAAVGMALVDSEGRWIRTNQRLCDMLGYRAEELVGRDFEELTPEEDRARELELHRALLRRELPSYNLDKRYVCKSGAPLWVHVTRSALGRHDGGRVVISVVEDISARKRFEEELRAKAEELAVAREAAEAASRAKSEFLANMSHEIRTPMAGVMGMTELLLDTEVTAVQRQYLDMVRSSAEALLTVINDVLDFSKIEAGRLELERVEFGLREVVERAAEALAVRAHEKRLELIASVDPRLGERYLGDPGRLRQVLLNLLGNAVKFTEHGEVVLTAELSAEPASRPASCRLRFAVRDTGIGIPREKQAALFEAFAQLDASVARTYGGTGLGLTISKRIADLMGSRLWVESTPGTGSTFSFEVELETAEPGGTCEVRPPADLAGRRAVVADPNRSSREVLVRALASRGAEVAEAEEWRHASELLLSAWRAGRPFDVAVLDVRLSGGDGYSLVEEVGREFPLSEVAVMMIRSDDVPGAARRCRELGVRSYVVKPIRLSVLLGAVASVLGAKLFAPAGAEFRPGPPAADAPALPRGLRILLAEDNPVNRVFVETILARVDASVRSVPDGAEALRALEESRFDVVLMDVQMPGVDGYEATRRLRAGGLRVPVVGLTAHAMQGDRERCLAAGMDDYLTKPVSAGALYRKLADWTKRPADSLPEESPEAPADLAALRETVEDDQPLLRELTEKLRATSRELLAQIESAAREQDPRRLEEAAHKLRGGLLVFRAREATALAEELEHIGREGSTGRAPELAGKLRIAVERLLAFLGQGIGSA